MSIIAVLKQQAHSLPSGHMTGVPMVVGVQGPPVTAGNHFTAPHSFQIGHQPQQPPPNNNQNWPIQSTPNPSPINGQLEAMNVQQNTLRDQIRQSEINLTAQHGVNIPVILNIQQLETYKMTFACYKRNCAMNSQKSLGFNATTASTDRRGDLQESTRIIDETG